MSSDNHSMELQTLTDSALALAQKSRDSLIVLDSTRFKDHASIEAHLPKNTENVTVALKPGTYILPAAIEIELRIIGSGKSDSIEVHIPPAGTCITGSGALATSNITLGHSTVMPPDIHDTEDTQTALTVDGGALVVRSCNIENILIDLHNATLTCADSTVKGELSKVSVNAGRSQLTIGYCRFHRSSVEFKLKHSRLQIENSIFATAEFNVSSDNSQSQISNVRFYRAYSLWLSTNANICVDKCTLRECDVLLLHCNLENATLRNCKLQASFSNFSRCSVRSTDILATRTRFEMCDWSGGRATVRLSSRSSERSRYFADYSNASQEFGTLSDNDLLASDYILIALENSNYVRFDDASLTSLLAVGDIERNDLIRTMSSMRWKEIASQCFTLDDFLKESLDVISPSRTPWLLFAALMLKGGIRAEGSSSVGAAIVSAMHQWVDNEGIGCSDLRPELKSVEIQFVGERLFVGAPFTNPVDAALTDEELADDVVSMIAHCACAVHNEGLAWSGADNVGLAVDVSFGHWCVSEDDDF